MTTTALHPVDDFARAVRAALSDLPTDEVEDLTDGLEADLAERASEQDSPDFGDPIVYASELRSAAGLPPRAPRGHSSVGSVLGSAWADLLGGLRELQKHAVIAKLTAFFVAIRPLWWVFRAWVFYGVIMWVFGSPSLNFNFGSFVVGLGSLILSVQLGRGRWQPAKWMRAALLVVNAVLVITVPVALIATGSAFGSQLDNAYAEGANDGAHLQNGLAYNGRSISNIFAYDANGKPLEQVQLYDQSGRPLYTVAGPEVLISTDSPYLVPYSGKHGRGGWNVYPLGFVTQNQLGVDGGPKRNAKPSPSTLNDLLVPPLTKATPKPTATPAPTVTPTPSATPLPTPTPTN